MPLAPYFTVLTIENKVLPEIAKCFSGVYCFGLITIRLVYDAKVRVKFPLLQNDVCSDFMIFNTVYDIA